ncbi:glycosyltransferase [Fuscovulum ytuae]|uniref:Glycosyltransferase n=1 Tax=Fuscovulum ytuae TaxID=3042299 RepID=A0ABY8Q5B4_9RHOB|nr:glycosyltransferase [Fuscovulum sp. YMD61]WGV16063.1 glycosyltransferase [Fuscovulum sp. YMD61]
MRRVKKNLQRKRFCATYFFLDVCRVASGPIMDAVNEFFVKNVYYQRMARVQPESAARHYIEHGRALNLKPHPFFADISVDAGGHADEKDLALLLNKTSVLFDPEFCSSRAGVPVSDALAFASERIANNEWVDFHPLFTEIDYRLSRVQSLAVWVDMLHDASYSFVGDFFCHFMPKYYRETASIIKHENEILDYLLEGERSGGLPHVFNVPWFTAQFRDESRQSQKRRLYWLNMLADFGQYGPYCSPFFDPLKFNHEFSLRSAERVKNLHPLAKFIMQVGDIVAPHPEVVPSALVYSFLDRSIDHCASSNVSGRDVIDALHVAMTGSTPVCSNPSLSICILNYNKPTHTALSAIAAARNAPENTEILVLDNGSGPKDYELLCLLTRKYRNISIIRSPKNLFFGEGNNILVDRSRGDKVLFLNNDAYVGPTTIRSLVDHLDRQPGAVAVGCTFLFPDLRVQEAGGIISDCGQQIQLHKYSSFELQRKFASGGSAQSTQYISSACFCVRRSVLDDVGGYDSVFEPLYFEDADLCKRIVSSGGRIDYLPGEYVIHFENASTREFLGDDFLPQISRNREKFRHRWLYRAPDYRPRDMFRQVGRARDASRPLAVIYTPYNIGIGGGERYTLAVAVALAESYNVIVATSTPCSRTRLCFALSDLGLDLSDDMIIDVAQIEELRAQECDLMIAVGNQAIPPIVMFGKRNIYHCQFPFPGHHEDRWQANRLKNVDAVIVNSEFTKSHLSRCYEGLNCDVPIYVTYAPVRTTSIVRRETPEAQLLSLINIGRFDPDGHAKRQDIAITVLREALRTSSDIHLNLVGGLHADQRRFDYFNRLVSSSEDLALPVKFSVNASRGDLEALLASSDVYFHACGFGGDLIGAPERQEHFGIAVVEGMMWGLIPVVFDGGGPAEIVRRCGIGFCYRSIDEAVEAVLAVSRMSPQERASLGARVSAFARQFSDEEFFKRLREIVGFVG